MPSVAVVVFEKRPRLASLLREFLIELPAMLIESRNLADLQSALTDQGRAICLINTSEPAVLVAALEIGLQAKAASIIAIDRPSPALCELCNNGEVLAFLQGDAIEREVPKLVGKLIEQIGDRFARSNGVKMKSSFDHS